MKIKKHEYFTHEYNNWFGSPSKCLIDVFQLNSPTKPEGYTHIFVYRELQDNQGASVTNMSEKITTDMLEKYNLNTVTKCAVIEAYPYHFDSDGEYYDFIVYEDEKHPTMDYKVCSPDWYDLKRHNKKIFTFIKKHLSEYPLDRAM
jgi:hypothetical protein